MLLKILGLLIVVVTSTLIGFYLSKKLEQRLKDLRALGLALQILEREMVFLSSSFPDALISASKVEGNVSKIFQECSKILKSKQGYCINEAWDISVNKHINQTFLDKEDKQILLNLGKNLGAYDIENQTQSIKLISSQLKQQEHNAEDVITKNSKMYKQLGFLGGIAIAIVLF